MADGEQPNWQANLTSLLDKNLGPMNYGISLKIRNNVPLNLEDGKFLFNYSDLDLIGHLASIVKSARFGNKVFFNVNVHINQTNICTCMQILCFQKRQTCSRCLSIGNRRIH